MWDRKLLVLCRYGEHKVFPITPQNLEQISTKKGRVLYGNLMMTERKHVRVCCSHHSAVVIVQHEAENSSSQSPTSVLLGKIMQFSFSVA